MPSLYRYEGAVIKKDGALAKSEDCCCTDEPPPECACGPECGSGSCPAPAPFEGGFATFVTDACAQTLCFSIGHAAGYASNFRLRVRELDENCQPVGGVLTLIETDECEPRTHYWSKEEGKCYQYEPLATACEERTADGELMFEMRICDEECPDFSGMTLPPAPNCLDCCDSSQQCAEWGENGGNPNLRYCCPDVNGIKKCRSESCCTDETYVFFPEDCPEGELCCENKCVGDCSFNCDAVTDELSTLCVPEFEPDPFTGKVPCVCIEEEDDATNFLGIASLMNEEPKRSLKPWKFIRPQCHRLIVYSSMTYGDYTGEPPDCCYRVKYKRKVFLCNGGELVEDITDDMMISAGDCDKTLFGGANTNVNAGMLWSLGNCPEGEYCFKSNGEYLESCDECSAGTPDTSFFDTEPSCIDLP